MPVPTLVTDLSTTAASNSPAGSENVFPSLDDYLRAQSAFLASIRDNSGNGWVSPYLPLTYSAGTANGVVYLNGSKVVTTGSGLTFDGTNFSIGAATPFSTLDVASAAASPIISLTATGGYRYQIITDRSTSTFRIRDQSAGSLDRLLIDSSGNLGLGVTPSAWGASSSALQFGLGGAINSSNGTQAIIAANRYFSGGDKYINSLAASAYEQNAGAHRWFTAPSGTAGNAITFTQAMTLDASGNLVVGKTTAEYTAKLSVKGSGASTVPTNLADLSGALMLVESNKAGTGYGGVGYVDSGGGGAAVVFGRGGNYDTNILFCTNPNTTATAGAMTERARITSGGDLLVGTTSNPSNARVNIASTGVALIAAAGATAGVSFQNTANGSETGQFWNKDTTGNNVFVAFYTETVASGRGTIDFNRAGGLTRYNTTSDYRAKDILGPVQDPGATIDALKVYEGRMKGATQSRPMLVAHEAQEHAPYAVSGVKDEVNEDGTPKFQQMDVSSLVPLLLAEIQSLRARVAALEA